jgi:hypothetical protein
MTTVTLYTKPDCCLCDEALEVIERVRAQVGFDLERVDVTGDRGLYDRYRERLPVVAVDGAEVFDYHVDEQRLRQMASVA